MTIDSPTVKVLLVIFVVIGVLATISTIGMMFMHGSMMGSSEGTVACQNMMEKIF